MEFINIDRLDDILEIEGMIKENNLEIKRLSEEIENVRKKCPDDIVVCVSKQPYFMGKDQFSRDKNICLICGKEVNLIKEDTIVIDMSSYNTGFSDVKEDIDCKLFIARYEYKNIVRMNPNISKDDLRNELDGRIGILKDRKKKVLEKKMN